LTILSQRQLLRIQNPAPAFDVTNSTRHCDRRRKSRVGSRPVTSDRVYQAYPFLVRDIIHQALAPTPISRFAPAMRATPRGGERESAFCVTNF
jgi:hypothetical protein